jgi:hypothetical protein
MDLTMMNLNRHAGILSLVALSMIVQHCDLGGPYVPARIIPGISVDDVRFGDSEEAVEYKLGKVEHHGWGDGAARAWVTSEYYCRADQCGLSIWFIDYIYDVGPVDLFFIQEPYDGKTKEGIGIGSRLDYVHQCWGQPRSVRVSSPRSMTEVYCFENRELRIAYADSLIRTMLMCYFLPLPSGSVCQ